MFCAIWYHLYNLKNVKNTHGGVLLLVKLLKVTLLHGCFSLVFNCTNGTKSRNGSHMYFFENKNLQRRYTRFFTQARPYWWTINKFWTGVKWFHRNENLENDKILYIQYRIYGNALGEKCPNTEFFLVRTFLHSKWIRRFTEYITVFSPNTGNYGPEKAPYLDTFHAVISIAISEWHLILSNSITASLRC